MALSGSQKTALTPGAVPGPRYSFAAKTAAVVVPVGLVCASLSIEPALGATLTTEPAVVGTPSADPAVAGTATMEEC